jgi:hypothetical protein
MHSGGYDGRRIDFDYREFDHESRKHNVDFGMFSSSTGVSGSNLQYFKHLGGFSSVLAALEQATRTDPRLIVHALALMNGAL